MSSAVFTWNLASEYVLLSARLMQRREDGTSTNSVTHPCAAL